MAIVTYTAEEAKNLKGGTDWERVNSMTEEEIHQAALDDPDAQPLTEEELKKFKRVVHRGGGVYAHDRKEHIEQRASSTNQG